MPDHQSSTDETSLLFGNRNPSVPAYTRRINLDLLKAIGLTCPTLALLSGFYLSAKFVYKNPLCETCYFDLDKTFIVKMFHFPHTCVMIDENPAKTPVAILFIIGMVVLMLWTYLDQLRIKREYAAGETCLKNVVTFSKYTWLFRCLCFLLFPLCFVNSPTYDPDPYFDPVDPTVTYEQMFDWGRGAWFKFILHYIPYLLWQLAVALQAVEQAYYHYVMGTFPFIPSKKLIGMYLGATVLLYVYYSAWIITFLIGVPFPGHTADSDPDVAHSWTTNTNIKWGGFIMLAYDGMTVIVPLLLSLCSVFGIGMRGKKCDTWDITFSPSKKD